MPLSALPQLATLFERADRELAEMERFSAAVETRLGDVHATLPATLAELEGRRVAVCAIHASTTPSPPALAAASGAWGVHSPRAASG